MKKITLCFTLVICLVFLCGCENKQNNTSQYDVSRTSYSTASPESKETELASFQTIILDKSPNRVYNIALTCSKINGIIVKKNEIFSFCNTVGKNDASTGYKEADVLDSNGNTFKGYGGGICQISSTLYNAVLAVNGLDVVERYEHSKRVYYVEKDKDAAVDPNIGLDFRFKNNTSNDIKIIATSSNDDVTIKLMKLE